MKSSSSANNTFSDLATATRTSQSLPSLPMDPPHSKRLKLTTTTSAAATATATSDEEHIPISTTTTTTVSDEETIPMTTGTTTTTTVSDEEHIPVTTGTTATSTASGDKNIPPPATTATTNTASGEKSNQIPAATTTVIPKPRTYKRRKIAIFFAYCGVGYQGMQKNPGAKTIEGDLEEALYQAGAVTESDRARPGKYEWARSARTDKGVSAVCQVASGRFIIDPPGFIDRLNSKLVDQIRVFGCKRVNAPFNAQKYCDRRRYVYLIPVFALDPNSHVVLGSSGDEVCLDCSKIGRNVFRIMRSDSSDVNRDVVTVSGNLSNSGCDSVTGEARRLNDNVEAVELKKSDFCYGEKERERFNRVLKYYVGTHNFHNFTSRITAQDPSAKRYIVSFSADTTVNIDGIEFVKCEVVGQSFLLHQIRKMVGLAVVIMRDTAPETLIERAFRKDVKINVPVAPEVGLYLDECFFSPYNKKLKAGEEEVSMKAYAEDAEDFKLKYIYPHIASTEHKDGTVALWLHYLNHRNYPDLHIDVCASADNIEPQDSLVRSNDGSSIATNVEVENASIAATVSSGGNSSAEDVVVKDIHAGGDGINKFPKCLS